MTTYLDAPTDLLGRVGQRLGTTDWMKITQDQVDLFADATGDHQWIHSDRDRAAKGPFKGTIAGVEVKSFAQVAAGQPIVTLYSDDRFEMSFLAPPGTFQSLKIGQPVDVKVADLPDLSLKGEIKELGSKAEQVSAFPVVVRLDNNVAGLNAGMAVEVAVDEVMNALADFGRRLFPRDRHGGISGNGAHQDEDDERDRPQHHGQEHQAAEEIGGHFAQLAV